MLERGAAGTTRVRWFVATLAGVVALCGSQVAQARKPKPHITATPAVLAANETTTLEGAGFPADETIVLRECATRDFHPNKWPCNSTEPQMTVETDASGAFTATFAVAGCQGAAKAGRPQNCWVGEYKGFLDGFELLGAAKLRVNP